MHLPAYDRRTRGDSPFTGWLGTVCRTPSMRNGWLQHFLSCISTLFSGGLRCFNPLRMACTFLNRIHR